MKFEISDRKIDAGALRAELRNVRCGALAVFEGWVRDHNDGRTVERLEYEAYRPLAQAEGGRILDEAARRFAIEDAICVHRDGMLELGEAAVMVLVTASHRDAAFAACRYIIDEVKHRLPVWKKEHYADGDSHWVNCQLGSNALSSPPPGAEQC